MVSIFSLLLIVAVAIWAARDRIRLGIERPSIRIQFRKLWSWQGKVDRGTYALVGFVAFAVKHNIDRIVATQFFGRRFTPFNYWIPPVEAIRIDRLSPDDTRFLATMVALALPFIWIGLAMTVRRLRCAALPLSLVILFFAPIVNLVFFLLLSLIPARIQRNMDES